jgi:hypothetical protein
MKRLILLGAIVFVIVKYIEANPVGYQVYTEPGLNAVNESQAALNNAQAGKINQEVQDGREAKDGYAVNVVARVVMGRGLTDAEQLGTTGLIFGAVLCLLPWLALGLLYVVWRLTKPMVINHE